jgi:uncharacterized circularly permuted ATP-grasp superfamily protein
VPADTVFARQHSAPESATHGQSQSQKQGSGPALPSLFDGYDRAPAADTRLGFQQSFDEWLGGERDALASPEYSPILDALGAYTREDYDRSQKLAELSLLNQGVTFSVYSDQRGTEKIFPYCITPRLISAADWAGLDAGLKQRLAALELFLDDVYGARRIVKEGVIPEEMVVTSKGLLPQMQGVKPPHGVRIVIAGIDLIRDPAGTFRVLEDNLRTPSGVSYVLENRIVSKRVMPDVVNSARVEPVEQYPNQLVRALKSLRPGTPEPDGSAPAIHDGETDTSAVLLTPGPYNSAYFEHTFLARTMGIPLVVAGDLVIDDDRVYVRTTRGLARVEVIYRRIDDAFLDPEVFRPDSLLGVKGLFRAFVKGHVALANVPGNGIADDKGIYPFVPDMIRFYLGEEPTLAQVETWVCARPKDKAYVLEHLDQLVVKAVDEAGGYGMLMGPSASQAERDEFRRRIEAEPRKYIAQHRVDFSTCPTWDPADKKLAPRRVDLRPYIVTGSHGTWVLPGGLSRVALTPGSYVVNSSQGGGSKDTWVLKPHTEAAPAAGGVK